MILSVAEYYKKNPKGKVFFHIVGDGDIKVINNLRKMVVDNNLNEYIIFHGFKTGKELDDIYNITDIAIGCLGLFRKNLKYATSLKAREYCAKGLPILMGEIDPYIKGEFIFKVSNNETLFDIYEILEWRSNLKVSSQDIRNYAQQHLTWEIQMKKVIDFIYQKER